MRGHPCPLRQRSTHAVAPPAPIGGSFCCSLDDPDSRACVAKVTPWPRQRSGSNPKRPLCRSSWARTASLAVRGSRDHRATGTPRPADVPRTPALVEVPHRVEPRGDPDDGRRSYALMTALRGSGARGRTRHERTSSHRPKSTFGGCAQRRGGSWLGRVRIVVQGQ